MVRTLLRLFAIPVLVQAFRFASVDVNQSVTVGRQCDLVTCHSLKKLPTELFCEVAVCNGCSQCASKAPCDESCETLALQMGAEESCSLHKCEGCSLCKGFAKESCSKPCRLALKHLGQAVGCAASVCRSCKQCYCDSTCKRVFKEMGKSTACAMHECAMCSKCRAATNSCASTCAASFKMVSKKVACSWKHCRGCSKCVSPAPSIVCGPTCKTAFKLGRDACAMAECKTCQTCQSGCAALYREKQEGLKCGMHAVNSVLANLGMRTTTEQEMNAYSVEVGAPSEGEDYDLATLLVVMMVGRGMAVQAVGDWNTAELPIDALLRHFDPERLNWLICHDYTRRHWIAYFRLPTSQWCDLDSTMSHLPAQELDMHSLLSIQCRAIIVPVVADRTAA